MSRHSKCVMTGWHNGCAAAVRAVVCPIGTCARARRDGGLSRQRGFITTDHSCCSVVTELISRKKKSPKCRPPRIGVSHDRRLKTGHLRGLSVVLEATSEARMVVEAVAV